MGLKAGLRSSPTVVGVSTVIPDYHGDATDYWGLAEEAAAQAMEDAGMTPSDIDGVVFITSVFPPERVLTGAAYLAQLLGIQPAWCKLIPYGGTPISEHFMWASFALENDLAKTILCVGSENLNARLGRSGVVEIFAATANSAEWEYPFGPLLPSNFAMVANRHMYEYGTTSEQLAEVAVATRQWAALNPLAQKRIPITTEDVLNSRIISSPLHMLDFSIVSDGAAAAIVTTPDRAADCPQPPVSVLGFGESIDSQHFMFHPETITMPGLRLATNRMLQMSGLSLQDFDIVYPYDPSTISVIVELESMGFCEPGEGGPFVSDGKLGPDGSFPINTHGGLLSCAHPGPSAAMIQSVEAIRQLRGECGPRQVPDARFALCQAEGGFFSWQVTAFGRN